MWLDVVRGDILEALKRMDGTRKGARYSGRKRNLNKDSKQSSMRWLET